MSLMRCETNSTQKLSLPNDLCLTGLPVESETGTGEADLR